MPLKTTIPNYEARMTIWSVLLLATLFGYFWYSVGQTSLSGMLVAETDACHQDSLGDWSYCSYECPCYDGEGDCDSDLDCIAGTKCVSNSGQAYGYEDRVDVCLIVD